ncbi:MAG TPA: hypothetical protein VOA87_01170 [Thermoanaerobaculia bacterium]|nr:hypothetical protein [Thermoanaerobaculia bacterium]
MNRSSDRRATYSFLAVLLAAASLAACGGTPSVEQVRWEIERQVPGARFERETHIHLGRLSMGLLHRLARLAEAENEGDRENLAIFRAIDRVDVATYKVLSLPPLDGLQVAPRFERSLIANGWTTVVRTAEKRERTWVLYRASGEDSIHDLFVVSLDHDELALVHVGGHLDRMLAKALAEHPGKFIHTVGAADREEPGLR